MCERYSKLTKEASDAVLVPLLLTLNVFKILLYCFLLTLNMQMADGILNCLNLKLSMHFRVGFKSCVTTVSKTFWPLCISCRKEHMSIGVAYGLS